MSATNLSTGRTKLHHAMKKLKIQWQDAKEHWNDAQSTRFEQEYLDPLEPLVGRTMQGIERLTQILLQAEQECSDQAS